MFRYDGHSGGVTRPRICLYCIAQAYGNSDTLSATSSFHLVAERPFEVPICSTIDDSESLIYSEAMPQR